MLLLVALLIVLTAVVARVDAAPSASAQWWSWWTDGADDGELAADAADVEREAIDDDADEPAANAAIAPIGSGSASAATDTSVSSADAVAATTWLDPVADPTTIASGGAVVLADPATTAGDPGAASDRLRRRSRWGAVDVTLGARRQWTLARGGTPAIWDTLWLIATWRH